MATHFTRRFRLWVELAVLTMTVFLALLTLANPAWIEQLSGVDPDRGNGALEGAIVMGFALLSVVSAVVSWREWRRPARIAAGRV
jgi:hypothetical protein